MCSDVHSWEFSATALVVNMASHTALQTVAIVCMLWMYFWKKTVAEILCCHAGAAEGSSLCGRGALSKGDHLPKSQWILTFRHRASCILGQAFHYSRENAFYIFNQQIYFII